LLVIITDQNITGRLSRAVYSNQLAPAFLHRFYHVIDSW